jgi:uncharacterized protein YkwD
MFPSPLTTADRSLLRSIAVGMLAVLTLLAPSSAWDVTKPRRTERLLPPIAAVPAESGRIAPPKLLPSFADELPELVNQERWNNGELPPLKRNTVLDTCSATHSARMVAQNFLAHCDLDNLTTFGERLLNAGYDYSLAGENIAGGQPTPGAVIAAWMASPAHRATILSTGYRELGSGYAYDPSSTSNVRLDMNDDCLADSFNNGPFYHYWTQAFGLRDDVYPVIINREAYQTDTAQVDLYLYGSGWATEMRIRNDGGTWTAWQAFSANVAWQLTVAAGESEVEVEIRNGSTVYSASDTIIATALVEQIFDDGFEAGDTNAWSSAVP